MRRVVLLLSVIGVVLLATTAPVGAAPAPSPFSFSDAQGDSPIGAKGDIVKVKVKHSTTVALTVSMVQAIPFSQWPTSQLANMQLHLNGTAFGNLYVLVSGTGAWLYNGESPLPCAVTRSVDTVTDKYTFKFPRSCINNPAAIGIQVFVSSPTPSTGWDFAPDHTVTSGFNYSRKVAFAP